MKVHSVIVCYKPDVLQLIELCGNVVKDGATVTVVDNTETPYLDGPSLAGCELITIGSNSGIAHAQNAGIAAAIEGGADVVVFFDQDSRISPGFLRALVAELNVGKPDVVSPLYLDDVTGVELPSLRVSRYGLSKAVRCDNSKVPYSVDVVISSGTAATREVFEVAGNLDEGFFIDFVDTEWCLRCRSKHIPIRVIPSAVMRHRVGSRSIDLGIITVLVHTPVRCYYQLRNCFHLFRKRHVPILFALRETVSVFLGRALLLLFVRDRFAYAKAYCCALRDGMRGVTGSKPL